MPEVNPTLPSKGDPLGNSDSKIRSSLIDFREAINGGLANDNLTGSAGITRANLASDAKGLQGAWAGSKAIATEESRTNTAFGTLTTADEITGVAVPTNGLIVIGYSAAFKSSVASAGRAAIFIGPNQLKYDTGTAPAVSEITTVETTFRTLGSAPFGLEKGGVASWTGPMATTGQAVGVGGLFGGMCWVFAAADTYSISVQFKATSGSVTAKERKLWVGVLGS